MGGEAACYFDPYDVEAMAETISQAWSDERLRGEMREKGLVQASRFSWERAAEQSWALYKSILPPGAGREDG